jgi:hypothetical protein
VINGKKKSKRQKKQLKEEKRNYEIEGQRLMHPPERERERVTQLHTHLLK